MDQSNRNGSNDSDDVCGACASAAAVNPDRQECMPPPYLKLIADCWEHILDYLSFKDMCSLGVTCKRLHRMVTYYLRENFPDTQFMLIRKEVHLNEYHFSFPVGFSRFVRTLCIPHDFKCNYSLDAEMFHSLKTLMFCNIVISNDHIRCFRNVLKNVEKLEFVRCTLENEIFEPMIDLCRSNLKTLNIDNVDAFLQHFPALEDFKCITPLWNSSKAMPGLKIFLEKHKKLKRFEIDCRFLWANRSILNETNTRLDQLIVHFSESDNEISFDELVGALKELYEREFFIAVHFLFRDNVRAFYFERLLRKISPLGPTLSALTALYPIHDSIIDDLSVLTNLKEIRFREFYCFYVVELEILAKSLLKLEKLSFLQADVGQIEPFVRHSKTLKRIKIRGSLNGAPINLIQLNQKRQQLENAQPIVIYLNEYIYLPAKWNSKYLNLNLVNISRFDPNSFDNY